MLYSLKTSPDGVPILMLANTSIYNRLSAASTTVIFDSGMVYEDFETACSELRNHLGSDLGAPSLPSLWTGPSTGASDALTDIINTAQAYFSLSHKADAQIYDNQTLGNSYGPIRYKSTLYANNTITDFFSLAPTISNRLGEYRVYLAPNTGIYILIHVIPEEAVSNDLTIIAAKLGEYDITIQANTNTSGSRWSAYIGRESRATRDTNSRYLLNNVPLTVETPSSDEDPYTAIVGGSTTGGGGGSGDFTGGVVGEPVLPPSYGLNSGFISAYSPSVASLNQLASYMWTSDFAENLKKVFGDNPMNTILGLSCVPVTPPLGGGSTVILGNIDTGISMPTIGAQYTKVNCGSIPIEPKYGAFLDYEPYTSIDLYLPYIGMVQLSTNDVMGKSLGVVYTVDVISGACVANVSCGGSIMYTFEGACATQFPVTNNDYSNMFKAAVDAASSIVGAVGGAVASGMTGNVAGAVTSIVDGAAGAATAAMNAHPTVNRSGSLSGSAGLMGVQSPFIVWTTPNMVASNRQNSFIGYPNFITTTLSGCAGYTEVENINLGIAGATSEEIAEIKTLLKNGVIF